jgi:hypothetical protein
MLASHAENVTQEEEISTGSGSIIAANCSSPAVYQVSMT